MLRTTAYRLRNFVRNARAIGLVGACDLVRHRRQEVASVRVRGIDTPLLCRTGDSDPSALLQVFGTWAAGPPLPAPPRLIVDGGANVGYSAVAFASRFPGARILAVEPDAENCRLMRRNCAGYPQVEVIQAALWPRPAELALSERGHGSWSLRVSEGGGPGAVSGLTISQILASAGADRIDVLKLDIEGSEYDLFSDRAGEWLPRVGSLIVELHDRLRPGCSRVVERALRGRSAVRSRWGEYTVYTLPPEVAVARADEDQADG